MYAGDLPHGLKGTRMKKSKSKIRGKFFSAEPGSTKDF
jgi:hypothetical protein